MSATDILRQDHRHVRRLERIVDTCQRRLYSGADIPVKDMRMITMIISDFVEAIHYSREEDSYFACVAGYGRLHEEIRRFMIEHEFGRRIAGKITEHLDLWDGTQGTREPVARFLRTYSIYLRDHLTKEDAFLDAASRSVLMPEEEEEMYEQFSSIMAVSRRVEDVSRQMDYLEGRPWYGHS